MVSECRDGAPAATCPQRVPATPRPSPSPPAVQLQPIVQQAARVERLAYTRSEAAQALGVSRSTFLRRVLPYVETIELPWGTRLIPADELERLLAEHRRPAKRRPVPKVQGRPRQLSDRVVERIQAGHT